MRIDEPEAERLLKEDLKRFEAAVRRAIEVPLNQHEFDACVSLSFNIGVGAFTNSTFVRKINRGVDKASCFGEEFPRWVNGPDGPLPGLIRRRGAEVDHALDR